MKTKIFAFTLTLLLGASCFLPVMAQAQEQKAQLYQVYDFVVKPAMVAKFEAGVKREIELGSPSPWNAFSTDDFHYYFLFPISNFAGMDSIEKAEETWRAKIGDEKFRALMKSAEGTFEYYKGGVIRFLPELSYIPKTPKYKPEEENFVYWAFANVEFGKEEELATVFKQWVTVYDTNKIPLGWRTYVGLMGVEMPLYFWGMRYKSAAEFWVEDEKATKTIGESKVMELWNKTVSLFKKYEYKTGRPRPDLLNNPKGK